jgi:hypothetical protein
MARGVSLHVGINSVSVEAFGAQNLVGCENDAVAMSKIALSRGFKPEDVTLLLGQEATFERVTSAIEEAAEGPARLVSGDIFLFTFAGHGSRIPNTELAESLTDEPDGMDESLVLFDRLLLDDYLRRVLWPKFNEGVRIVGVSDSCHSATVLFALSDVNINISEHISLIVSDASTAITNSISARKVKRMSRANVCSPPKNARRAAPAKASDEEEVVAEGLPDRAISRATREAHDEQFKPFYEELKKKIPSLATAPAVGANLLLMAACEDGKKTKDGVLHTDGLLHGAFTRELLAVWKNGAFAGTYVTFMNAIIARITAQFPEQLPILTLEGPPAFSSQQPFSI